MVKNNHSGKFIVLEGLDGAGKSTQAALIASYLKDKGFAVCQTSEPTQFLAGGLARACLLGQWQGSPECLQLLFAADRADHLAKEVWPHLKEGVNVISDRYFLSSLAYGSVDCDMDWLAGINSRFLAPDATIYLEVPPAICAQRIIDNGKSIELFERVEILEIVRQNYQKAIKMLESQMRIAVIDGNQSREAVAEDVAAALADLL